MNVKRSESPTIYRSSKLRYILVLFFSLLLMTLFVPIAFSGESVGYVFAALGLFGVCISVTALLPASGYVKITGEGFEYCYLFRSRFVPWHDVVEFGTMELGRWPFTSKWICFNLTPGSKLRSKYRRFSRKLAGWDESLREDYGSSTPELISLLSHRLSGYRVERRST